MITARRTLFSLCCAFGATSSFPAGAVYLELTASTLVSRPAIRFTLEQQQTAGREVTTLMHAPSGAERRRVAVIEISDSAEHTHIVLRLQTPARTDPEVAMTTLERLYTLALQLDPEARLCFEESAMACDATTTKGSHAEALRQIALARQKALAQAQLPGTPWSVVVMSPTSRDPQGAHRASARVTLAGKPLTDTRIHFSRAPHSACFAKTAADGVAWCELVDQHGDEDEHGGGHEVVATFPGDVTLERILPPTTGIVSGGRQ
jgi:hypothetical protein